MTPDDGNNGAPGRISAAWRSILANLGWPGRVSLIPLAGLLPFGPIFRDLWPALTIANGQRIWVGWLELLFVALVLVERRVALPGIPRPGSVTSAAPPRSISLTTAFLALLSCWVVVGSAATLAGDHANASLIRQAEWLSHTLFAYALYALLRSVPRLLPVVAFSIPASLLLQAPLIAIFALSLDEPAAYRWNTALPGFGNIRHIGYLLVFVVLYASAAVAYAHARSRSQRQAFALLTFGWTAVLWSGGRGAFLSCVVAIAGLALLRLLPRPGALFVRVTVSILIGAVVSIPLPTYSNNMGVGHFVGYFEPTARPPKQAARIAEQQEPSGLQLNVESPNRRRTWQKAAVQSSRAPFLGVGPDGFSFAHSRYTQPHNLLAQSLVEWGILGSISFLLLLLTVVALARSRISETDSLRSIIPRVGAIGAFSASVVYSAVDGGFYFAAPLCLAATSIAIALQPGELSTPVEDSRSMRLGSSIALLALGGILALNTAVTTVVSRPEPPLPGSIGERLLIAFPHRVEGLRPTGGVLVWGQSAWPDDPDRAIHWLHFGHASARRPWQYLYLEAFYLSRLGEFEATKAHLRLAEIEAGDLDERLQIEALRRLIDSAAPDRRPRSVGR